MRQTKLILIFVLAVSAASYLTGLARIVLGFAFETDTPYMGLWNDIAFFPLMFAVLEWPITAVVFLASVQIANSQKSRLGRWGWTIVCMLTFSAVSTLVVAIRSAEPWGGTPLFSLFDAYSQGWSDASEPRFKLVMVLALGLGGLVAAVFFDRFSRPYHQLADV